MINCYGSWSGTKVFIAEQGFWFNSLKVYWTVFWSLALFYLYTAPFSLWLWNPKTTLVHTVLNLSTSAILTNLLPVVKLKSCTFVTTTIKGILDLYWGLIPIFEFILILYQVFTSIPNLVHGAPWPTSWPSCCLGFNFSKSNKTGFGLRKPCSDIFNSIFVLHWNFISVNKYEN